MPTVPQSELPKPESWNEFEDIVADLYTRTWDDPQTQRYGRSGQEQQGVDIYGRPAHLQGRYAGVQCKRYDEGRLTRKKIEAEIAKAERFSPPLAEYTIATTDRRDSKLQQIVRQIDEERLAAGKFSVHVIFWEDLCGQLSHPANNDLLLKHYADWAHRFKDLPAPPPSCPSAPPPNPFTDVVAIRDPARFVGRERMLERLLRMLAGGSVALVGERKIGKSSLLHCLADRLRQEPGQAVVFWDFYDFEDARGLLAEAIRQLGGDGKTREDLKRAVHGRRAVLLLDEFDLAPERGFDLDHLRGCRALCQAERGLRLVTASRDLPKDIFPDPGKGSWPYDFLSVQRLGPFTEDEARRLLAHPWVPDALHFDTPTCDELLALSACHPYRLQRAAHHRHEALHNPAYDWRACYDLDMEALG